MARKRPVDFRYFSNGKEPATIPSEANEDRAWWNKSNDDAAVSITSTLSTMRDYQQARMQQYIIGARLYGNAAFLAGLGTRTRASTTGGARQDRISLNMIQSHVDTLQSKLGKERSRPFFLTSGGNYHQRRKARKLTKLNDGIFYECDTYAKIRNMLRDGMIFGDGFIKVVATEDGRVAHDRVFPHEIWVDEQEGLYNDPRQLHQIKMMDRSVLLALYPDAASIIQDANDPDASQSVSRPTIADSVEIRESWHLPSKKTAKDGKWIITVDGHALCDMRPWNHDWFPFAHYRWCDRVAGWFGQGLAEQLQNRQIALNRLDYTIDLATQLMGSPMIFLSNSSRINDEAIGNNAMAKIVRGDMKPEFLTPPPVNEQLFTYRDQVKTDTYFQSGLSQLAAGSQKPAGLNAGVALRTYHEIESERFEQQSLTLEAVSISLAKMDIATVRDILDTGKDKSQRTYKVKVLDKGNYREIDFNDVEIPEDELVMQCYPTSALPMDPAARQQTVTERAQAGFYTPREAKRLLNFPDLESVDTLQDAAEEHILMELDGIVDDGKPWQPDGFDDAALTAELATEYLQEARTHRLEPEREELLMNVISDAKRLIQTAAAQNAPPAPAPGMGAPQAPPVPPQPNDMIQNTPQAQA